MRLVRGTTAAVVPAMAAVALAPNVSIHPYAGPHAFERLLVQLAEVAAFCACGWLSVATAITMLAALLGEGSLPARIAVRVTPRMWARLIGLALGGAVTLGPTAAAVAVAVADDGAPPPPRITGLRLPDRPIGGLHAGASSAATVVVHRGDTLWRLAAARLPAGSDDAAIARACRRLYAANRAAIGPDPDLLLPGTRLELPSEERETNP